MATEGRGVAPGDDTRAADGAAPLDGSGGPTKVLGITVHDPDGTVWRRGVRLAIAVPIVLGLCLSIDAEQEAAFAVFGCVAALGMADFGGPRQRKAWAYVELVLTTGSTALQAVAGTFIGFVVATAFLWAFDNNTVALWVALPILCFLSMWLAGAIGLVAGQAGFALLVVVLFNLIVPTGWETGLQRVETVAIGAAVSIIAGLLFWPRGAEAVLRSDVAAWYRAARDYCALTVQQLRGDELRAECDAAQRRTQHAQLRAEEAFDEYLNERGTKYEPWASWGPVLRMPAAVAFGAFTIDERISARGVAGTRAGGCEPAEDAVELTADRLHTALTMESDLLEHPGETSSATLIREFGSTRDGDAPAFVRGLESSHLVPCLEASAGDERAFAEAFVLVWTRNWLVYLLHASAGMPEPLGKVTASANRSWFH